MAKRVAGNKKIKQAGNGENGGIVSLTKELFQAGDYAPRLGRTG